MKNLSAFLLVCLAAWAHPVSTLAKPQQPESPSYKTGFSSIMKLGGALYSQLKPPTREFVSSQPISVDVSPTPFVRLLYYPEELKPIRGVWISAGFIDLANQVAHAKAIDSRKKGYFKTYIAQLAQENGGQELKPLPNQSDPSLWTEDILNEQASNFNSIVGVVVGINLAHHYLGHYDKYQDKLNDGKEAIESLVTPGEWEAAFAKGVRNALDAGCLIEGAIPFYEAFGQMPKRPAWAIYFLPETAKVSKMKTEMEQIQKRFLTGQP